MNDILTTLQPWYPSIGAFCFFLPYSVIFINAFYYVCLGVFTNVISLKNGNDLISAFEHPINVVLFVIAIYAAINLAPVPALNNLVVADKIMRSNIVTNFSGACTTSVMLLMALCSMY